MVMRGVRTQAMKTAPTPVKYGGLELVPPAFSWLAPGNTKVAPSVLATAQHIATLTACMAQHRTAAHSTARHDTGWDITESTTLHGKAQHGMRGTSMLYKH